ncbi:class I SAM-dependent methyltransferase [Thermodesulfobacteriota bacterium]
MNTHSIDPCDAEVRTGGRVISGPIARFVDLLENIVYMGRLEEVWRRLIARATLLPGDNVVDAGCGTGRVALLAAEKVTDQGRAIGIDASAEMITLARKRAEGAGSDVEFRRGAMEEMPFGDETFDAVLSCQALHHLPRTAKLEALGEMRRILKPGGRLVLCDHGKPYRWYLRVLFYPVSGNFIDYQAENLRGEVPGMISEVFGNVEEVDRFFGWMRT